MYGRIFLYFWLIIIVVIVTYNIAPLYYNKGTVAKTVLRIGIDQVAYLNVFPIKLQKP